MTNQGWSQWRAFRFHYPARGRKRGDGCWLTVEDVHVQIPLPRKGTETLDAGCFFFENTEEFRFHYPARGRKPNKRVIACGTVKFRFHYPARGRKLEERLENPLQEVCVQIPLPRKGTETALESPVSATEPDRVQIPLPRKRLCLLSRAITGNFRRR